MKNELTNSLVGKLANENNKAREKQLTEDIHVDDPFVATVRRALMHWEVKRDYYGPAWDGIEKFHFHFGRVFKWVAIEVAGWYKYRSSSRDDMDGKDWRLVAPLDANGIRKAVVVNCHSLLHDGVWTLGTTVYSTDDVSVESLDEIGDDDHWRRSMMWTIELAKELQRDGYDYTEAILDMDRRLTAVDDLHRIKAELMLELEEIYKDLYGAEPDLPSEITIAINDWDLKKGKIGMYRFDPNLMPWGMLVISPKALDDKEYVRGIIKHELIHAATEESDHDHIERFDELADAMGLPDKWRN